MSDISLLGGALGLGTPSYDPKEAKGYLTELGTQQQKTEREYNDIIARRREKVDEMRRIVEDATQSLLQARQGEINLPLLAAGAAMMMPTSTGGLGASLGQAGMAAAPFVTADRQRQQNNIMQLANLQTMPLTMGEVIDRDTAGQLATRLGNLEQQRSAVTRGTLTAQMTGMKAVQKEVGDLRRQAAQEAKNQMASALRSGSTYEKDNAEVERELTDAIYAQLFHQRYGTWPGQATAGRDLSAEEIAQQVPKMPRSIPKETKQERDTYTSISTLGQTAEENLSALDFAEPAGSQVPGMLAGPALWAAKLAEVVGLGGDWGKEIADAGADVGKMKAILNKFVLSLQTEQKGVQTEGDAKRMQEAIASVSNPAQLNKLMFSWMRSQALAARFQADLADQYVRGNKNRASGINAFLNEKARLPLVRPGPNNAKVTLWDYVDAYARQNPDMPKGEAQRKAIEMWQSLG